MFKRIIVALVAILASTSLWAQNAGGDIEMADAMRANGMIYVVVAVAAVVMIGLLAFVFATDRKISRVEKELKEK